MRKSLVLVIFLIILSADINAQFNLGIAANYINYAGEIDRAVPGAKLVLDYNFSKRTSAAFEIGAGATVKKSFSSSAYPSSEFDNQARSQFMSLALLGAYHLIKSSENKFGLYVPAGVSFILNRSKLSAEGRTSSLRMIKQEIPNSLALNAGIGGGIKIGKPLFFAEAGISFPVGSKNSGPDAFSIDNPNSIPFHTIFAVGLKLPLKPSRK